MIEYFLHHLKCHGSLDTHTVSLIQSALKDTDCYPRKSEILRETDPKRRALVLLQGLAITYKSLSDGRRQVLSIMIPGDFTNLLASPFSSADYAIQALQDCRVAEISMTHLGAINQHMGLLKALSSAAQVELAVTRQWLIGLGRRTAEQRVAHLLCELFHRLLAIGRVDGNSFEFPLSLTDIADIVGLSTVHACRAMRALQKRKLLVRRPGRMIKLDVDRIVAFAAFDKGYLGPGELGAVARPWSTPQPFGGLLDPVSRFGEPRMVGRAATPAHPFR